MSHRRAVLCALILAPVLVYAAAAEKKKEEPKWDVNAAHGPVKTVRFTTDEGTWLDLDVSPDGKRIVFSMLGDLYVLPIEGGVAKRVTHGAAWDVQPRFSADGSEVAFTSDRGGGNNIWRMPVDGGEATQVTKEDYRLLNNPVWTPDGQYIIAKKHFSSTRSLGAGELWLYHKTGGAGIQLTKKKNEQQDLGEPAVSADGRYVYFSEDVSPGPTFQYNKNPHDEIYAVKRLDRQSGEIESVVDTTGGAIRPQPSPDGKTVAFVRRVREKTVLYVQDLESGEMRPLWDGLSHDMQEAWAIFGPYANYNWTPDSRSIVIWAKGGIWRVDAASGQAARIPFRADVEQTVAQPLRFEQKIESGTFEPHMIRDVATSPDGKTMVFHAVGHLWTKSLPNGKPQRLTHDETAFEYDPSFSMDGRKLLYTTWNDVDQSAIIERDLASGGTRKVTSKPGFYYKPKYSPDGTRIVYAKTSGTSLTGSLNSGEMGIYLIAAAGGEPKRLLKEGANPQFSADGTRVYYVTGGELSRTLKSIAIDGTEPRDVLSLKYVDFVAISPDGRWVAFTEAFNAYVAPMPQTGVSFEISKDTKALPVTAVSTDVGSYLHWSASSSSLHWMVGRTYHSRDLKDAFAFLPGAPKQLPKAGSDQGVDVGLTVDMDRPTDTFAFTGARIVTMRDSDSRQEVIENGVLVVEGDTVKAVGTAGSVTIPAGAKVIDAKGKTIVPGYVDVHAHANHFDRGVIPQQNWAYYTNLSFGVTTAHDPSAATETVFSQSELVKSGALVGPRVYSTGAILYGADGLSRVVINSIDDARANLRRMKAHGAFSVKSYNQPRREQRQQINQAARELGMLVVEEGGSTYNHNMTMILDGVTSIEHNIPVAPLYNDVVNLWKETDVRNTLTLVVSYGGVSGENYWFARDNVWEDKKLNRFYPRETLDARAIRREIAPEWDYYYMEVARAAKKLRDAGVKFSIGGHGELQGMSANWEMWMLTQGGFTNWEALRAGTIDGADMLGLSKQIGSLAPGKRADFAVLNTNPLENIRATIDTRYVSVNGRLFDVDADMAEVGGKHRAAPVFYWQRHRDGRTFGREFGPTGECMCPKSMR